MKYKLTLITILFVSLLVFGQDRVNREKLNFETTSETLSKATGWAYNSTLGEWIDYENVISSNKDYKDKYESLTGKYMMSKESQNFIDLQIKTINLNDEVFYVLILNKWNGKYKYPALKEEWITSKLTMGYIYSVQEYSSLKEWIDSGSDLIEIKTKLAVNTGRFGEYDEVKFLDLIQTTLLKNTGSMDYVFPLVKTDNNKIRFKIPFLLSKYDNYDIENEYFEIELDDFSVLLIK